jgi:hypothetical protein
MLEEVVTTGSGASGYPGAASGPINVGNSVRSTAATGALGELFQYTVGNVSLPRQKSAMIPIISDSVAVERLSIYNASVLGTNPLNGVRLDNTTGKHLLQGPVTVLEKSGYAGDARIDNVPPGQNRLLSYGIDLDMTVDNSTATPATTITTAKIYKGTLAVTSRVLSTQQYVTKNNSAHDKVLVIEHPRRTGWSLVDTPTPFESTPTVYRFKETVPANAAATLVVKEETLQNRMVVLLPTDAEQLLYYTRVGEIPKDVRDAIAKAIEMKQAITDVERHIRALTQQISEITTEQTRIRENMKTVSPSTSYYERLLTKLNDQESSIERLQAQRVDLTSKRDELRNELEAYLQGLSVG